MILLPPPPVLPIDDRPTLAAKGEAVSLAAALLGPLTVLETADVTEPLGLATTLLPLGLATTLLPLGLATPLLERGMETPLLVRGMEKPLLARGKEEPLGDRAVRSRPAFSA